MEAWNHRFAYEYDLILAQVAARRIPGIILLGGMTMTGSVLSEYMLSPIRINRSGFWD
ncbi:hypothetical protein ACFL6S_36060 [Candidatus Poribacteria bacterium]